MMNTIDTMRLALEALTETYAMTNHAEILKRKAITALREALANEALDKMAENARELGLDYEPSAGTQVSKVWWDGERLMAKPIPLDDFYEPAPVPEAHEQEPVAWMTKAGNVWKTKADKADIPLYASPQPAQRTWVHATTWRGLTDEEREQHRNDWHSNIHDKEFRAIEAKLKAKNSP